MSVDPEASKWKVLIVDDDRDNLGVAAEYLEFVGAEVRTASDGQQGMSTLEGFMPTVILMDLSMPHMDGWKMLAQIRENPATSDIPVIALTAHAMADDRERALESGFDGYITKPFVLASLLSEMKDWLARAGDKRGG